MPLRRVSQGGHGHVGPKPRRLLPRAPSLLCRLPVFPGGSQHSGRPALADILGRVEARKVASESLVGLVAENSPCTRIPATDASIGIEHQNRVIVDPLYQESKPFFAL